MPFSLALVLARLAIRLGQQEKSPSTEGLRSGKETAALGSGRQPLAKDDGINGEPDGPKT